MKLDAGKCAPDSSFDRFLRRAAQGKSDSAARQRKTHWNSGGRPLETRGNDDRTGNAIRDILRDRGRFKRNPDSSNQP